MRTLITNGTVVNADGSTEADVLVDGERIAAVGSHFAATDLAAGVDRTIDATATDEATPGAVPGETTTPRAGEA